MAAKLKTEAVEDFATEFADVMGRERRMRKYLREHSADDLEKMIQKLEKIRHEKIEEEEARIAEYEEKKQNIAALRELMEQQGLTDADLTNPEYVNESASAKKPRKPKYLYIDKNGERHEWTGKGRPPLVFNNLMKSGINLDQECLSRIVEERLSKNEKPHPSIND
ncbi:TPA: H-NS family nucleoid-associated regulatory protein [Vibrio parahaemolyticus]|uniref:H-NS family histone-like protein n=1 Tax=Vibrio campbellii TaxID=680 RepID=UPI001F076110|nr:H-NS family nucleoid-associated regulatory protein [Vibrio campbellii]UMM06829.1 H-NS histone family protein [Vibrio campbellii]